jgi:hypothetical protein
LDCHSFSGAQLSEDTFDAILLLLAKTAGNTEKRRKIIDDVIGPQRSYELLKQLKTLE